MLVYIHVSKYSDVLYFELVEQTDIWYKNVHFGGNVLFGKKCGRGAKWASGVFEPFFIWPNFKGLLNYLLLHT